MSKAEEKGKEDEVLRAVSDFGNWLVKNHVPSFGPETGILLVRIRQALEKEAKGVTDPLLKFQIQRYSAALQEVVIASAIHQKFVIEGLAAALQAVTGPKEEEKDEARA